MDCPCSPLVHYGVVIGYLKGDVKGGFVVAGGVGYRVETPHTLQEGAVVELWVETTSNDGALRLFGFSNQKEAEAFRALVKCPGLGPATAISLLRDLGVDGVVRAVRAGDENALSAVRGVGKTTARKLMVTVDVNALGVEDQDGRGAENELVVTLVDLGYDIDKVHAALDGLEGDDVTVLTQALGRLNGEVDA